MYSAGDKLPESTGDDDSTPLGKLFQTVLGKYCLHWGILYAAREHSYTSLRNIKTAGDTLILAGENSYTPLGNIKTPFSADDRPTLLGESIADLFIVVSLS